MRSTLLFWMISVLTACLHPGQTVPRNSPADNQTGPTAIISLEREFGECLGKCPVYKILLYETGEVDFWGFDNVRRKGLTRHQVRPAAVRRLKNLFEAAKFHSLQDEYVRGKNCSTPVLSDADTAIVRYVENGMSKRVKHYQGCMQTTKHANSLHDDLNSLFRLEKAIVEETETQQFISGS